MKALSHLLMLIILLIMGFCAFAQTEFKTTKAVLYSEKEVQNIPSIPLDKGPISFTWPNIQLLLLEGPTGAESSGKKYRVEMNFVELNPLPYVIPATSFTEKNGLGIEGDATCCTQPGNWAKYLAKLRDYTIRTSVDIEYSYGNTGAGYVELHYGSITGPLLKAIDLPNTTGWKTFKTISVPIGLPAGNLDLFLVYPKNVVGQGNIKTITFK